MIEDLLKQKQGFTAKIKKIKYTCDEQNLCYWAKIIYVLNYISVSSFLRCNGLFMIVFSSLCVEFCQLYVGSMASQLMSILFWIKSSSHKNMKINSINSETSNGHHIFLHFFARYIWPNNSSEIQPNEINSIIVRIQSIVWLNNSEINSINKENSICCLAQ